MMMNAKSNAARRVGRGRCILAAALLSTVAVACSDAEPWHPSGGARVGVTSDPPGARILLDGRFTGRRTPDTIGGLSRRHDVAVRLDTLGVAYGFLAQVEADPDAVQHIHGPLVMRCPTNTCWEMHHRFHTAQRLRFASNPVGTLFMRAGTGEGLLWPAGVRNSYVSAGMPVFAALAEGRDTIALGIYDQRYLAGRPAPIVDQNAESFALRQASWVLPPLDALTFRTVRGIEIEQHVVGTSAVEDALLVRLVFRNVTGNPAYAAADPIVPAGGIRYDGVYIGFALDPDIGDPRTDWVSYEPALDMVFAYSSRMRERDRDRGFDSEARDAPGLVGLRVLDAPAGSRVVLNAWAHGGASPGDWRAGFNSERLGWGMLSGMQPYAPYHTHGHIGHLPTSAGDMRMSVSVGPLQLRPGDEASVTVAVLLAAPVAGTFTPGTLLEPGDPLNTSRPLARVAAHLFEYAAGLDALLHLLNDE
jgi:hypothetical protein